MNALLENKVIYFRKNIGLSKTAIARLYPDRVQIVGRDGTTELASFGLNEITDVRHPRGGLIRMNTGEQLHGLGFVLMPYRMFGLLGIALSGGGAKAKAWADQLTSLGVGVRRKVM